MLSNMTFQKSFHWSIICIREYTIHKCTAQTEHTCVTSTQINIQKIISCSWPVHALFPLLPFPYPNFYKWNHMLYILCLPSLNQYYVWDSSIWFSIIVDLNYIILKNHPSELLVGDCYWFNVLSYIVKNLEGMNPDCFVTTLNIFSNNLYLELT